MTHLNARTAPLIAHYVAMEKIVRNALMVLSELRSMGQLSASKDAKIIYPDTMAIMTQTHVQHADQTATFVKTT